MVKGVTDGPRISQDFTNMGMQPTEEAKTPSVATLPEMNGILDYLGVGTLGGDIKPFVAKGKAEDTPRQDGVVKNRGESVKAFFSKLGQGISSFFGKIGEAFSKAFEAIKEAVTARIGAQNNVQLAQTAPTPTAPKPVLDGQGRNLKDFCEELGKALEKSYQDYLGNTQDDPPMGRSEFVKQKLPDPPGGRDGIDPNSSGFVGDRIDDVRANMSNVADPGLNEMRQTALDRLTEMPTVDIAIDTLFDKELGALKGEGATLLRSDSAYTKLEKFRMREAIPFDNVAQSLVETCDEIISENGHLSFENDLALAWESISAEQADGVLLLSDHILNDLLDTNPDKQGSYFNSIPDSYRQHLFDRAEDIMKRPGVPLEERQEGVKMMYANTLFLRGIVGDLTTTAFKVHGESENRNYAIKTMQFVQTFLNGAGDVFNGKSNDNGVGAMNQTMQTHGPRLEAFLLALGMPSFGETPTTEDQKTVTE